MVVTFHRSDEKVDQRRRRVVGDGNESLFTLGSKLRVKYGRGPNQKIYEAKVSYGYVGM